VVVHFPSKHEALDSISRTEKKSPPTKLLQKKTIPFITAIINKSIKSKVSKDKFKEVNELYNEIYKTLTQEFIGVTHKK
jgi:hypothetical protein